MKRETLLYLPNTVVVDKAEVLQKEHFAQECVNPFENLWVAAISLE